VGAKIIINYKFTINIFNFYGASFYGAKGQAITRCCIDLNK
jgi:hypothetical protein